MTGRTSSFTLLASSLLASGAACGGFTTHDPADAGSGAAGGVGGAGGTSASAICTAVCNDAASANCPVQSECLASCADGYTHYPSCKTELDAFLACGMTYGTWECDPATGSPKLGLPSGMCVYETSALTSCIAGG